jgi:RNA recognition motif-containing protein
LFSARTAKQSSPAPKHQGSDKSLSTTQKSKETDKKSGKTSSQTLAKTLDSKDVASSEHTPKKSRYGNIDEGPNNQADRNGDKSSKKSKQLYVDAVEKLENSSSIHVPKKLVLFVGNLPEDITKEQLMAHFKRAGLLFYQC